MPSALHEILIDLIRNRPLLVADLLPVAGVDELPDFDYARTESGDFPDINPTEYRADGVVNLVKGSKVVFSVIVEAQLRWADEKFWSWPVYVTTLRARLQCPVALLVLCPSEAAAERCSSPIPIAPGCEFTPTVLGPAQTPVITDRTAPAELVALSAVMHRNDPDRESALDAFVEQASRDRTARLYIDFVMAILPKAARLYMEELMASGTYAPRSEYIREYYEEGVAKGLAEGEVKGEVKLLLTFLRARDFAVSDDLTARITTCTDPDQLKTWAIRAATATTLDDIFGEE